MAGLGSIMSPLETINKVKDEKRSLDSLARFPYPVLMGMVKNKEIKPEEISIVMGRKAEIIQEEANRRALEQRMAGGIPSTITDRNMALIAQSEAPRDMTDVGIAQNEVPPMRMAGGGIIAFENGGGVSDRWKALGNDPTPYYAEDFRRDAAAFFDPIVGFLTNREGRERIKARELKKAQDMQTADSPLDFDMYKPRPVKSTAAVNVDPSISKTVPVSTKSNAKPSTKATEKVAEDPYEELKKLFREDKAARATSRTEARDMALLEAGLNILGGESPYAMANIGKGASAAARGYGEKISALRKEDRDRARDYADIVAKQQDMGLRREDMGIKREALDIQRLLANKAPAEIALVERYAKSKGVPFDEAVREVYGAKRKEDPIAAMVMDRISKGEKVDRTSLAKNMEKWQSDYGITPTR